MKKACLLQRRGEASGEAEGQDLGWGLEKPAWARSLPCGDEKYKADPHPTPTTVFEKFPILLVASHQRSEKRHPVTFPATTAVSVGS